MIKPSSIKMATGQKTRLPIVSKPLLLQNFSIMPFSICSGSSSMKRQIQKVTGLFSYFSKGLYFVHIYICLHLHVVYQLFTVKKILKTKISPKDCSDALSSDYETGNPCSDYVSTVFTIDQLNYFIRVWYPLLLWELT